MLMSEPSVSFESLRDARPFCTDQGISAEIERSAPAALSQELVRSIGDSAWYRGERVFAVSVLGLIFSVTAWVVKQIFEPLVLRNPESYSLTLGILSLMALYVACYGFHISFGSAYWSRRYKQTKDTNWHGRLSEEKTAECVDWHLPHHIVMITAYMAEIENLETVMYSLTAQKTDRGETERFCRSHITLVLAMEEREGEAARQKVALLQSRHSSKFTRIIGTFHPSGRSGEIPGKASNYRYAVEQLSEHIEAGRITYLDGSAVDEANILIHVGDDDSLYHANHFPNINFDFCTMSDRQWTVWQPLMLPNLNFWEVNPMVRQFGIMVTAQEMMSASQIMEFQIPFSTYGVPYITLKFIGGGGGAGKAQDGDVITEDHHLFIKGFFASGGRLRVQPIFLPCFNYTVNGCEFLWRLSCCCFCCCGHERRNGFDSRFTQAKRHMIAVSECAYVFSLVMKGGCCCRRYRFGPKRIRLLFLCMKLFKIHAIAYVGFWMALGAILFVALKGVQVYCDFWPLFKAHDEPLADVCRTEFSKVALTPGAVLFSVCAALGSISAVCVQTSFVLMIRRTQDAMVQIGRCHLERQSHDDHCTGRRMSLSGNRAGPWFGQTFQLVVEYFVFGLIGSVYYGTIPGLNALLQIIWYGHRLKYVSAAEAEAKSQTEAASTEMVGPNSEVSPAEIVNGRLNHPLVACQAETP